MKAIPILLLTGALLAQDAQPKPTPELASLLDSGSKSVIIIEPKARAADYAQAFDFLRKDKPTQKIMVRTASATYTNVADITPSAGGTLLLIKMLSNQGTKTQIVPVEQIMEIGYSL